MMLGRSRVSDVCSTCCAMRFAASITVIGLNKATYTGRVVSFSFTASVIPANCAATRSPSPRRGYPWHRVYLKRRHASRRLPSRPPALVGNALPRARQRADLAAHGGAARGLALDPLG